MQCPKCAVEMDEVRKLDVVVDACSKCGGIWLDKGELEKIREAEASYQSQPQPHEEHGHEHSKEHGHHEGEGSGQKKKKKRGGFLTDLMEGFGGE